MNNNVVNKFYRPGIHNHFKEFQVDSEEETASIANKFAKYLHEGDIVAFYGELGTGKTFFIRHLCKALGIIEEVSSPSFTLINEYHTRTNLYVFHFDFYRLEHQEELTNLGVFDFLHGDGICFIEWAEKIYSYLPSDRYEIFLEFKDSDPDTRIIRIGRKNTLS
jgi:tRNA threonylcarbamoyladenosine biosynthesis protein TsaE